MAYLDYNSTTPVDSRIIEIMVLIFNERFGNPSSVGHVTGRTAGGLVDDARKLVGQAVGMRAPDVIFTSGATEANNLAFMGLRRGLGRSIMMATPRYGSQIAQGVFKIRSQTDPEEYYEVKQDGDKLVCSCPDHFKRMADCKHIHMALEMIKKKSAMPTNP